VSAEREEDNQRVHVRFTVDLTMVSSQSWTQGHTMGQIVDQAQKEALGRLRQALESMPTGVSTINSVTSISVVAKEDRKL
jgi:hypothetical protein